LISATKQLQVQNICVYPTQNIHVFHVTLNVNSRGKKDINGLVRGTLFCEIQTEVLYIIYMKACPMISLRKT